MKKLTDIFGTSAALAAAILKEKDGGGTHVSPNNDRWLRAVESGDAEADFCSDHPLATSYLIEWQQKNVRLIRKYIEERMYCDNEVQPLTAYVAAIPEIHNYFEVVERWREDYQERDKQRTKYQRIDRAVYGGNVGEDSLVCALLANWVIKQVAIEYVAATKETDL